MNASQKKPFGYAAILAVTRRLMLIVFLVGAFGAGAELLLLEHTEDSWQLVPLLLIALSLVALVLHFFIRRAVTVRIFQAAMLLFTASGVVGTWLHYQAKVEFKLEMNPDLGGMALFREVMIGATLPPVLAPGLMIQLGLLGLAYTYRHPALAASTEKPEYTNTGE
jgi:hypothetical protein